MAESNERDSEEACDKSKVKGRMHIRRVIETNELARKGLGDGTA